MSVARGVRLWIRIGCDLIEEALKQEKKKKYDESVKLYTEGLKYLITALGSDGIKNKKELKSAINQRIETFTSRVDRIKKKMDVADEDVEEIQGAQKQVTLTTIFCIHGYVRQASSSLNVNYDIPSGSRFVAHLLSHSHSPTGDYHGQTKHKMG